jgi:hypothetical protein
MFTTKVASAAALLVVLGGTAACGSSDSSSADSAGPTDADKSTFCDTFKQLSDSTTPKEAASSFQKVGTPSDISDDERQGYEVLVSHLSSMDDDASSSDLANMQKSLSATDQKNVVAFVTYVTKECAGVLPSAPSS